jgi:hypothetical protein
MITDEDETRRFRILLCSARRRIDLVNSYESRIARVGAPRFNVFNYIEPDENKATEILADLLDPAT